MEEVNQLRLEQIKGSTDYRSQIAATGERKVVLILLILRIPLTVLGHCQWYLALAAIIFTRITKAVTPALGLLIMSLVRLRY